MRRDCWGKGLATEAARACRDHGFKKAGLRRLISIIESENAASIRVAEKMGMTLEERASFHGIPVLIYSIANLISPTNELVDNRRFCVPDVLRSLARGQIRI